MLKSASFQPFWRGSLALALALSACGDDSDDLISDRSPTAAPPDAGALDAQNPDLDSDQDGLPAARDNCPLAANSDQSDRDRDGIGDQCDNCLLIANHDQSDADGDRTGDLCESDAGAGVPAASDQDGDGVDDRVDRCPKIADPAQQDVDADRHGDLCDNCPTIANFGQGDADRDGLGDTCAALFPDRDADGVRDYKDNCRALANADQADADRDGVGDVCDNCASVANASQFDGDRDSIGDRCDSELGEGALCALGTTQANPLKPNLYFLLDRSLSMGALGSAPPYRIDTLKAGLNTLAGTAQMPGAVVEGFNLGVGAFPIADGSCAPDVQPEQLLMMAERSPVDAFNAFVGSYANLTPMGFTPTDVALARVRTQRLYDLPGDTALARAKAIVLITDGTPNDCVTVDQPNRLEQTITEAGNLAALAVPLFVLGFEGVNAEAMQRIADAGDPAPGTNTWYPINNTSSIVAALNSIITRTASCTLPLTATGIGSADRSVLTVELVLANGAMRSAVPSDPVNGYTLDGADLFTLHGAACVSLQSSLISDVTARVEVKVGCSCVAAVEVCGDDLDNDCDGLIDEDCVPGNKCGVDAPPVECENMPAF